MEKHHFQWVNPLFLWPFSIAFCMFTREYQSYVEFWEPRWPRLENLGVSHLRYARNVEVKLIQPWITMSMYIYIQYIYTQYIYIYMIYIYYIYIWYIYIYDIYIYDIYIYYTSSIAVCIRFICRSTICILRLPVRSVVGPVSESGHTSIYWLVSPQIAGWWFQTHFHFPSSSSSSSSPSSPSQASYIYLLPGPVNGSRTSI